MPKFKYPVKNPFHARAVTEPTFEEDIFGESNLYVNLDEVRGKEYLRYIKFDLGISSDGTLTTTNEYVKLIFSGHIGSGKTVELTRLHHQLNKPEEYFSIFIGIEEEVEISRFVAEDFYVLLIAGLLQRLDEAGISQSTRSLEELSSLFLSDEEIKKEISETYKDELEGKAGLELNFLSIFKMGGLLKNYIGQ